MADDSRSILRAEILRLAAGRVPSRVCNGSYNAAVDYKAAVTKAVRTARAPNSTLGALQESAAALRRYAS